MLLHSYSLAAQECKRAIGWLKIELQASNKCLKKNKTKNKRLHPDVYV